MLQPSLRTAGCYACRSSVLSLAVGRTIGLEIANTARRGSLAPAGVAPSSLRRFASFSAQDRTPESDTPDGQRAHQGQGMSNHHGEATQDAMGSDVPWYLQVEAPRHPTLVPRQTPLPDVPADSPRVMEPLLKFVSDDLGMDELNLLDLRALDPPPALGPQLIMLFGTARSERHLHVSADRLVRWLRGHGITATADGLLGRNELKIKLRRKARRAKLVGNTGSAAGEDDGISTRWICVNLGTIGWSSAESQIIDGDGRVSGFGSHQTGTTIVVQMLTEAKRQEMDLEYMWIRKLERSEDKQSALNELGDSQDSTDAAADGWEKPLTKLGSKSAYLPNPSQRRLFSTSARQHTEMSDIALKVMQPLLAPSDIADLSKSLAYDGDVKMQLLERLKMHVQNLARHDAIKALRHDSDSAFQRACCLAMQNLPSTQTWAFRACLYATAIRLGHSEYKLAGLGELIKEMKLSGVDVRRDQCLDLLQAIYCAHDGGTATVREQSEVAMELLEAMHERGESVLANDIIVTLIEALARSRAAGPEAQRLQTVLENLRVQLKLPCLDEAVLVRLLDAYASQGNWDRFWETWRIPPRYRLPRSPAMYQYIYRRMADTNHQSRCIDTVRWCFHEMINEDPPVRPVGKVLEALKACIRVADPEAEAAAKTLVVKDEATRRLAEREFIMLLRKLD